MSDDNGQMSMVVRQAREWVQQHGPKAENLEEAVKVALAGQDYMVERISRRLVYPMWTVGAGLFANVGVQAAKWLLGG